MTWKYLDKVSRGNLGYLMKGEGFKEGFSQIQRMVDLGLFFLVLAWSASLLILCHDSRVFPALAVDLAMAVLEILEGRVVASLASLSTISFPGTPMCAATHRKCMEKSLAVSLRMDVLS